MRPTTFMVWAIALAGGGAFAADKPMKLEAMPPDVQQAIRNEAKGATIKNTLVEVENGQTFYEAETIRNGRTRDFLVDANGVVVETEDAIDVASAPAPVQAALEKAAAGGKIERLERVTRHGTVAGYEARIVKNGRKKGVSLKPDGTPMK